MGNKVIKGARVVRRANGDYSLSLGRGRTLDLADEGQAAGGGDAVLINDNVTIDATNAGMYNGKTLEWTTAAVVTLSEGLPDDFGFNGIPPGTGNASIAKAGSVTLNGAGTTLTRAAASNALFAVVQRRSNRNAYIVTGA